MCYIAATDTIDAMPTPRTHLDDELIAFIGLQPLFFVATAPLSVDGHVNLSPKGLDTLAVIDPHTIAYLDLTGSGAETIAHLQENGRIVVMLCSFDGKPRILRLHGRGEVVLPGNPGFDDLRGRFAPMPGVRSIIRVRLTRISTSCGFGVPLMTCTGQRRDLPEWCNAKGEPALAEYRHAKNRQSIDGLPALPV